VVWGGPSEYDDDSGGRLRDRPLARPLGILGRLLMWTLVFTFLIYWLVAFVGSFTAVEIAQDALYDEVTPRAGLKVTLGSVILALTMTYFHPSFETMFTTNVLFTVLQAIVWFAVFMLILQFHPWHALGLGVLMMTLVSPLATMGVDSMLADDPQAARIRAGRPPASKPVRQSLAPKAPVGTPAPEAASPGAATP